jgi:hypothetical protein
MNDSTVRRANQLTTTFLDTLGTLLLAAAAGWWLWVAIHPAVGLAASGAVVIAFSLLAQRQATVKTAAPVVDDEPLPGPADPGNLHVMGR